MKSDNGNLLKTYVIVSALIKYKNKYLIAKRSSKKRFAPNEWELISGFVDKLEPAEVIILEELGEELNMKGTIVKSGEPYILKDKEGKWIVIPYLIEANSEEFVNNPEEHSDVKWVTKDQLHTFEYLKENIPYLEERGLL